MEAGHLWQRDKVRHSGPQSYREFHVNDLTLINQVQDLPGTFFFFYCGCSSVYWLISGNPKININKLRWYTGLALAAIVIHPYLFSCLAN
jgi:hypothetical protein